MSREWLFREFRPGDTHKDPIAGAFFQQDALEETTEAVVRESVQNSLDATVRDNVTRVRFRVIHDLSREDHARARAWFKELGPRVAADDNGLHPSTDLKKVTPILVIEDFGTRGLMGDATAYQSRSGERNDFFAFFRAEGFHQKDAQSLGKWGIGKTVFPRSSRLNAFLGYSIREGDPVPVLMGRVILKTHSAQGTKWHPDGYLGVQREDGLVLPLTDSEVLQEFCDTFKVQRRDEAGLSVVVPYADDRIDESHLIKAAIHDYFVPLLEGRLVVEVVGDDPDEQYIIDSDTVDTMLLAHSDSFTDLDRARVETAKWALTEGRTGIVVLPEAAPDNGPPGLEDVAFTEEQLAHLRRQMNDGRRFAVRQPFVIRPRGAEAVTGAVEVFFQPAELGKRVSPVFVRDGIVVWGAGGRTTTGCVAFVMVSGEAAAFVGASENVAHTEWNQSREGFKDEYIHAAGTLKFIKNFPSDLLGHLRTTDTDEDPNLLEDVFFVVLEPDPDLDQNSAGSTAQADGKKNGKKSSSSGEGPGARSRYSIVRREGGFTVSTGERDHFAGDLRLRLAYQLRNKNPLKSWAPTDFALDDGTLAVVTEGDVTVAATTRNELLLQVGGGSFSCTVTGFDGERDLFVKVDVVAEGEANDDA